jgi:hypothetical protein
MVRARTHKHRERERGGRFLVGYWCNMPCSAWTAEIANIIARDWIQGLPDWVPVSHSVLRNFERPASTLFRSERDRDCCLVACWTYRNRINTTLTRNLSAYKASFCILGRALGIWVFLSSSLLCFRNWMRNCQLCMTDTSGLSRSAGTRIPSAVIEALPSNGPPADSRSYLQSSSVPSSRGRNGKYA